MSQNETSRRNLLYGAAAVGVAVPVLAACGSSGPPATANSPVAGSSGSTPQGSGGSGITTTEIPVGGGTIFPDQNVVVTQPTAGHFKAFSATCTHQGCTVAKVAAGTIDCPCHFSRYSITDGAVVSGPAPSPLPQKTVTVTGTTLKVS
ncbi:MAG: putative iron sulfur protein [Marmoricola sp.]|nr:putative iron sulfur protein [Marmoricola sp.]